MLNSYYLYLPRYTMSTPDIMPQFEPIILVDMRLKSVDAIMEDLSKRDSRFRFIKESYDEFLYGEFGLHQVIRQLKTSISNSPEPDRWPEDLNQRKYPSLLFQENPFNYLWVIFYDIVTTAIYELLNVFDIDITLQQALEVMEDRSRAVVLLEALNEKSKALSPQPAKPFPLNKPVLNPPKEDGYRHPNRLESTNIRVLCIQPGPKESPIQCSLEERNLDNDIIEEALSYVWGKPLFDKAIDIDGSSFDITTKLNDILRSLRHEDVTRKIWIDAICINQSDLEEKSHQVRLMRDIYSKAQKTSIWLGDWPTEQMITESDFVRDPLNVVATVPEGFGNSVDQYDIASILDEYLKCQTDISAWDEKQLSLGTMLMRCVNIILMHEWWERVWTIQEAALPPNEPIIHLRGYQFPFGTLISAMDAAAKIDDEWKSIPDTFITANRDNDMYIAFVSQIIHWRERQIYDNLFLLMLRPEKRKQVHLSNPQDRLFQFVLRAADSYRATDPRDKIFALESLLIRSIGRLMNVDYNESTDAVFKRATARGWNQSAGAAICCYKLSVEQYNSLDDGALGPSWVHDLACSDAITPHRFILRIKDRGPPICGVSREQTKCFATPRSLFCSGVSISTVYYKERFPDLREGGVKIYTQFTSRFLEQAGRKILRLERQMQDTTRDITARRTGDSGPSINTETERLSKDCHIS
ncbi:heterokaryon incompatibility protein-domain-containing protein [Annulohypoxylon truncatum]|uniref:heterokaryon incompatibility protein-domain-containing protein n=1 Tax=Annulohypoxylon truncatum TaxID=327061 RepID=UPI0020075755|nr:heterokaryon incompatibility protein-domain-containing protein [Annulohypoxylon truncatum]KAI1212649.1 heterokaryon incompatibility protein-domain-containing protein [Annulohypoxylon truncatum]